MKADEILTDAETQHERVEPHLRCVADWFHDHEGELFTRDEAVECIADDVDIDDDVSRDVVRNLVSDTVDPVVQVPTHGKKYVGVIDYTEHDGAYSYTGYDDVLGKRPVVVCAQCVHEVDFDEHATYAAAGDGSFGIEASLDELLEAVHDHYDEAHDEIPENVETGASLVTGTTIGGSTAFHAGNDGSGSGLDADYLDGNNASDLEAPSSTQNGGLPTSSYIPSDYNSGALQSRDGQLIYKIDFTVENFDDINHGNITIADIADDGTRSSIEYYTQNVQDGQTHSATVSLPATPHLYIDLDTVSFTSGPTIYEVDIMGQHSHPI